MKRRIPIDETFAQILADAARYREELAAENLRRNMKRPQTRPIILAGNIFLNTKGRGGTRQSLLHAAQRSWKAAGLSKKKVHEVRHTLGTMAGRHFTVDILRALLGQRSRKSSEIYVHPDEDMATEARQKIITELSQTITKGSVNGRNVAKGGAPILPGQTFIPCPYVLSIFSNFNKRGRNP